jgi:hypothetical protein
LLIELTAVEDELVRHIVALKKLRDTLPQPAADLHEADTDPEFFAPTEI